MTIVSEVIIAGQGLEKYVTTAAKTSPTIDQNMKIKAGNKKNSKIEVIFISE